MKAKHIRRLRKRIVAPGYYEKRLQYWLKVSSELETFWKFECSDFFRGSTTARHNQRRYNRDNPRVESKIAWYERRVDVIPFLWLKQ